ncbi:pilus assembly protein TadG-related protein [uncultured Arthrobacter sp.]|uniref:pilus assembly protein TadG-related protein n=1 Tax=uncultured Arthrobacter sp. TaxID=114050 RepID=UPI002625E98D|nr:pilus assembly protein TadG-related protein [uncultured Arthrobacter sp.]
MMPLHADRYRENNEDGQISVLIIGYILLSLLVVAVVTAVSAVYIEHKKLLSVADGAALSAADTFSVASIDTGGGAPAPTLDSESVSRAAAAYLERSGALPRFNSLDLDPATGAPDPRTARVVLSAEVHPPIVNFLVPAGIPITATADARADLTR